MMPRRPQASAATLALTLALMGGGAAPAPLSALLHPASSPPDAAASPAAVPPSVRIGNQLWMRENLAVTRFRNGDAIPMVREAAAWAAAGEAGRPAYAIYGNASAPRPGWGLLYNYAAISDPRGLCPQGWRVPTKADWAELERRLGAQPGAQLKARQGWGPGGAGTDAVGFAALPAGFRTQSGQDFLGDRVAYFWPADAEANGTVIAHMLFDYDSIIFRIEYLKAKGMSVRCLADAAP